MAMPEPETTLVCVVVCLHEPTFSGCVIPVKPDA
jgi:hypothetical protein